MKSSTKETYAIPFLHVIREHPFILKRYSNLFDKKNNFSLFYNRIKNLVYAMFWEVKQRCFENQRGLEIAMFNK